jgi:peptidyl-prolyl cis-trans isomerase D
MLKILQQSDTSKKIFIGILLGIISLMMVVTMVPGLAGSFGSGGSPDAVATVGGSDITATEVQQMVTRQMQANNFPPSLRSFFAKQVLDQMVFQKCMELEAQRLGMAVTPQELTDQIKLILPAVFAGDTWVGKDRYAAEVEQRTGMTVPEFEDRVRESLLAQKMQGLVTDGVTVTPGEIEQEFKRKNEKVKLEYAVVKAADLVASINPTEQELSDYFSKHQASYKIPEKRSAHYALLDATQVQKQANVTDADMQSYYNQHIAEYQVPERAHVEHILFKTVGKTEAEIAEIQQKANEALKKAKAGANFEALAKEFSDDTSKDKGGDIGWITRGQTVKEFEAAAFTLKNGAISDLVKTQYGFHIIKVLEREAARTKPIDEVRLGILEALSDQKETLMMEQKATDLTRAVHESNRQSVDDLAKKFNMETGDTAPSGAGEAVGDLGNTPELRDLLFHLQKGELSTPVRIARGFVILTVKDIQPAHAATLAEVHDKVLADYRQEKSGELAKARAEELAKRVHDGATLEQAAKALGMQAKSSEAINREGSIPDLGSGQQLETAFGMKAGQTSDAVQLGQGWVVYTIAEHTDANPQDFEAQKKDIEQQLLQSKRALAFEAFKEALQKKLKAEGKVVINEDAMKRLSNPA